MLSDRLRLHSDTVASEGHLRGNPPPPPPAAAQHRHVSTEKRLGTESGLGHWARAGWSRLGTLALWHFLLNAVTLLSSTEPISTAQGVRYSNRGNCAQFNQ